MKFPVNSKAKFFGCVLLATFLLGSGMSRAANFYLPESLFPQPECNVGEALEDLPLRLAMDPHPCLDGDVPWPGVLGVWVDVKRDVYLNVYSQKSTKSPATRVNVVLRSICTDKLLAFGSREIVASDAAAPSLKIRLHNYQLGGRRLVLDIKAGDPQSVSGQNDSKAVEVRVDSLHGFRRNSSVQEVDTFNAAHFSRDCAVE